MSIVLETVPSRLVVVRLTENPSSEGSVGSPRPEPARRLLTDVCPHAEALTPASPRPQGTEN